MKAPDLSAIWTKLPLGSKGREYPQAIALNEDYNLPESIILPSQVSVLFGMNGVGKSRILKGIAKSLPSATLVEVNRLISYMLDEVGKRDDIDGLIEENSPQTLSAEANLAIRDLVRRDYDKVDWYAVPFVDSPFAELVDDDVVPIFQVRYAGVSYDFRGMGLGELSAHLLLWLLQYGRGGNSSLLLMDEPEAFLPAPSRAIVLNYILDSALRGKYGVVVASHSTEIIYPAINANAAVLVAESGNAISLISSDVALRSRVSGMYGISSNVSQIFLCEDESAFVVLKEYLKHSAVEILQTSAFLWCNGFSDLEVVWKHLPKPRTLPAELPEIIFVGDGDKENDIKTLLASMKKANRPRWRFIALPYDPDFLFKKYALEVSEDLARVLGIPRHQFMGLLDALQGRNPHDWRDDILKASAVTGRQAGLAALASITVPCTVVDGTAQDFLDQLHGEGLREEEREETSGITEVVDVTGGSGQNPSEV